MRRVWIPIVLAGVLVAACDDDEPTNPGSGPNPTTWPRVAVVAPPGNGLFGDIAFSPARALAAGGIIHVLRGLTYEPFLATLAVDGTWEEDPAPLPANAILTAIGFVPGDEGFVAGFDFALQQAFVLDERGGGWSRHDVTVGGLSVATDGVTARIAGSGSDQLLMSTAADTWSTEPLPFPGAPQERGLFDIDHRSGVWATCGFDDGGDGTPASPNAVLFENEGSGWIRLDVPCQGCTNVEFRAVAVTATGAIYLGGAVTDFGAGSADEYVAFLMIRSSMGDWVEVVLPEAGRLDRVNDILIASDETIYVACGMTDAYVVRSGGGASPTLDATFPSGRIRRLAEDADGDIWAAGGIVEGLSGEFAIWKRPS